jgi:sugar lactone lactonase YvrE
LRKIERAFPEGVVVIGVHAGKFIAERVTDNIRRAATRLEVHHPIVNDRQFRVWRAYAVNAWPTITLIDAGGYVVAQQAGEIPADALIPVVERLIDNARIAGILDLSPLPFAAESESDQTSELLRFPAKLALDAEGRRLFVADTGNSRIVAVRLEGDVARGVVEWTAGGDHAGFRDGPRDQALFDHPLGLTASGDFLYIADTGNHTIRQLDLRSGEVSTSAGTGEQARSWVATPEPTAAPVVFDPRITALSSPWDLCVHGNSLFIAMAGSHQIWRLELSRHEISPWCGSGAEAIVDGPRNTAALAQPSGLALTYDRLYFADSESSAIRWAALEDGTVHTLVGTGLFDFGDRDGTADRVRLQHPLAIACSPDLLYVADTYNNKIKQLNPTTREVTTWLGENAALTEPSGLTLRNNLLYIADTNNHRIVVVNTTTADTRHLALTQTEG